MPEIRNLGPGTGCSERQQRALSSDAACGINVGYVAVRRLSLRLYHYGTGVQYKLRGRHPISDIPEGEPNLLAARDFARRQGVSDISSGYYFDYPKEESYSSGLTMDWNFCEDFDGVSDK